MDKRTNDIIASFLENFDGQPTHLSIAPGRVNLIGEHTDYNDGFVLPVAIEHDVRLVYRRRDDRTVRLYSLEFDAWAEFSLDSLVYDEKLFWANYVMGVAWALQEQGIALTGLEGVVSGNVPRGSGLSSSAALEVCCARAFLQAAGVDLPGPQIALATQRAENKFVGVNSGIMDQFISVMGQADHALLIDCRSLDYELIPFPKGAALVIGNTRASRSLASSAYNQRRTECEAGVAVLKTVLPTITALRDVTSAQLEAHKALLDPVVYRRCRHVIGENERVIATTQALAAGDLEQVGELMNASHASLRDDYEVSSPALDAMVDAMRSAPGVLGARLTGAGFGGCAVALVRAGGEEAVSNAIYHHYPQATSTWPDVYISPPSIGSRVMEIRF